MTFFILFAYMESWFTSPSSSVLHRTTSSCINTSSSLTRSSPKLACQSSSITLGSSQKSQSPSPSSAKTSLLKSRTALHRRSLPFQPQITLSRNPASLSLLPSHPCLTMQDHAPQSCSPSLVSTTPSQLSLTGEWRQNPAYEQVKTAVENLTPVNDSCERALALATKFNGSITKDEESYWELVLVQ